MEPNKGPTGATMEQLEMLAGRALLDAEFLHALLADPQYAANTQGIHLGQAQVASLEQFRDREEELIKILTELRDFRTSVQEIYPHQVAMIPW
ncbi:MAG: hypothetical protein IT331_05350 [Anaerolineae bacterium]|nr:hypothetical protein [Anaerolineae bacterium]